MLLEDVIKEFIYEIQIRNYTERTIKGYKNNILRFAKYIKTEYQIELIEDVTPKHIKEYLKYLLDKKRSPVYINTILKNLRSFFKYSYEEGYSLNIAQKVSMTKEKKTVIKTFTDKEVKKILDYYTYNSYIKARNKCIIAMLFDTGIRNFELCNLKQSDIKETSIWILGKGRKERNVAISPYLKKVMIKYERIRKAYLIDNILHYDNYFLSYRNKPLTIEATERVVKLACMGTKMRSEIRCSPHTCRHYFAQAQLKNGLDVYSLSRLLGHESIVTTRRYLLGLKDNEVIEKSIKTSPLMNLKL